MLMDSILLMIYSSLLPPEGQRAAPTDNPDVVRYGVPHGYSRALGGVGKGVGSLSYSTKVEGSCGDAGLTLHVQHVETQPAERTTKASVTRFAVRDGGAVVTTDVSVIGALDGYSLVAARPDCQWPVLGLELLIASHEDEPQLVRRYLQFKGGEVSYFLQEPLDSMDRVRWAVPR